MVIDVHKISDFNKVLTYLDQVYPRNKVFTLTGDLGAGKTTFVKLFCERKKVTDLVNSPTFSIINEYQTESDETIYHMDLYRLESIEELMDIGFEEYLYSGHICLIEWPQIARDIMTENFISLQIEIIDESYRKVVVLPCSEINDHE